jgi:hypothetical protein
MLYGGGFCLGYFKAKICRHIANGNHATPRQVVKMHLPKGAQLSWPGQRPPYDAV